MRMSCLASVVLLLAVGTNPASAQIAPGNLIINDVQLTDLQIVGNVLTADGTVTGTLGGLPFETDIVNFALQLVPDAQAGGVCAILDLELGPINLELLGLFVDTSRICLKVTAIEGGGLLGDLLCGLAGDIILPLGLPATGLPTGDLLASLEGALTSILGNIFNTNTPRPGNGGGASVCRGQCDILELVLGPVDLTLLGLNVLLDNCAGGPVQVCISASRNRGILGQLLCGLTRTQLPRLTLGEVAQLATRALALSADGNLSRRDIAELTALLATLIR